MRDSNSFPDSSTRDVRVDFVRGVALLVIFSDHIDRNFVNAYTPHSWGLADMAEVFVFISGYVTGVAYEQMSHRSSFWLIQWKAVMRSARIYLAFVLSLLILQAALLLLHRCAGIGCNVSNGSDYRGVMSDPGGYIGDVVFLRVQPPMFCILPLYMVLVIIGPAVVFAGRCCMTMTLGASACLYLCAQVLPDVFSLCDADQRRWYFNPFCWQCLFVIGALIGCKSRLAKLVHCVPVACLVTFIGLQLPFLLEGWFNRDAFPLAGKGNLGPLRLVHGLCVLMAGIVIPNSLHDVWTSRIAKPFVICGQNSLVTFCCGAVLSSVVNIMFQPVRVWPDQVCVNALGWCGCFAVALCWGRWRRRMKCGVSCSNMLRVAHGLCSLRHPL